MEEIPMNSNKGYEMFKLYKKSPKEYKEFINFLKTTYLEDMAEVALVIEEKAKAMTREQVAKEIARSMV